MQAYDGGRIGDASHQLRAAMDSRGLTPPTEPILDGKIHRCPGVGGGKRDDAGWYIGYTDGAAPAGSFGCWRTGITEQWSANIGRELTADERATQQIAYSLAREARESARAASQETAAIEARRMWAETLPCDPNHDYMTRKGLKAHPTARVAADGRLVVPIYGSNDEGLISLQHIAGDGAKRYLAGCRVQGGHCWLGWSESGPVYVAEGYATALTIHQQTGRPSVAAYSAGNLVPVVAWLRESLGASREIVIVADQDKNGIGQHYADQAGARYGCRVVVSPTPSDLNDHVLAGGDIWAVLDPKQDYLDRIPDVIQPSRIDWLIKKWVPKSSLIMVHGPPASFKSFLLLSWCCEIARTSQVSNLDGSQLDNEREWGGQKVRPGTVAYLAGEGRQGLMIRLAAWRQHTGHGDLDMYVSKLGCDLNKPSGYQTVADSLRALPRKPALVVVDTLHRFMDGDENSSQDSRAMIDNCQRLIDEFACAVILVHHTPKSDPMVARGSSSWKGALDVEINISGETGIKCVQQLKLKEGDEHQKINVCLETVPIAGWLDEDGEQVTSAVIQITDQKADPGENRKTRKNREDKISEFKMLFETCWRESGRESRNGAQYVSRSALKSIIERHHGHTFANNAFRSDRPDRMMAMLATHGHVLPAGEGYAIADGAWSTVLSIE
jgi:phage/plasmid primase-like uncharacterized protein